MCKIRRYFILLLVITVMSVIDKGNCLCCPALTMYQTINKGLQVECRFAGTTQDCYDADLPTGTEVKYMCLSGYAAEAGAGSHSMTCTESGRWSQYSQFVNFKCTAQCGLSRPNEFLINAEVTHRSLWPWHGILYRKMGRSPFYTCGGTLVGPLHFITAAHCVADIRHNPSELMVVLGAISSDFKINRRTDGVQILTVKSIDVQEDYRGPIDGFHHDIAVLTFTEFITFSNFVLPVCLPPDRNPIDLAIKWGDVVGFGRYDARFSNASAVLRHADVPIASGYCRDYFDSRYQLCGGFPASTEPNGTCQGDSGGGYTFRLNLNGNERNYIYGIVSAGSKNCIGPAMFTNVQAYMPWLTSKMNKGTDDYFSVQRRRNSVSSGFCPSQPQEPVFPSYWPPSSRAPIITTTTRPPPPPPGPAVGPDPCTSNEQDEYDYDSDYNYPSVDEMRAKILRIINYYRIRHRASPLVLGSRLSAMAQSLADQSILTNKQLNATMQSRYGQTLFDLRLSGREIKESDFTKGAVCEWYNSKSQYVPSRPQNLPFTQLVWKKSSRIGIGIATGDGRAVVTCLFYPQGNILHVNSPDPYVEYHANVEA